ncbi:MAG TPA: nitroreductase/quinone reductase family protein [Anaerolineales bacterium]|nr:nitroreductase/quinone reductase family protein [Anaerolineales bacterium]
MEHPGEARDLLSQLATEEYCYLTTTGRVSGRLHEIEIWFGLQNNTLYLLSGSDKSDWLKNLLKNPSVAVRLARHTFVGIARLVKDKQEDRMARTLLAEKYQEWEEGKMLSQWARTALPVAIDLSSLESQ